MDCEFLSCSERINVVGTSGSGKSTFGRELAEILRLPFYEIDQLFWKAGWQETSDEELLAKLRDVCSQPKWILDGNYLRTNACKWEHVQVVIWLDLSFARTVWRVAKRAMGRCFTKKELWPGTGNRETFGKVFFSRDSIIWWAITSYRTNRKTYAAMMASPDYSHIRFLRLRSPNRIAACLESVRRRTAV